MGYSEVAHSRHKSCRKHAFPYDVGQAFGQPEVVARSRRCSVWQPYLAANSRGSPFALAPSPLVLADARSAAVFTIAPSVLADARSAAAFTPAPSVPMLVKARPAAVCLLASASHSFMITLGIGGLWRSMTGIRERAPPRGGQVKPNGSRDLQCGKVSSSPDIAVSCLVVHLSCPFSSFETL